MRLEGDAEKVRLNLEQRIKELQDEVRKLSSPRGLPPWELIQHKRLTEAATEVGFSGLRGNTDIEYLLRGYVIVPTTTAGGIQLRPNGATTNLRGQGIRGSGSTATASAGTNDIAVARTLAVAGVSTFEGTFYVRAGDLRTWQGVCGVHETSTPETVAETRTGRWADTTTEVTSLLLVAPTTGGFGAESEFSLYRRTR